MKIKSLNIILLVLLVTGCLEPDTENIWSLDKVTVANTTGYCRHIFISDNLAFVAAGQAGIQVWNMEALFQSGGNPELQTHLQLNSDLGLNKDINKITYSESDFYQSANERIYQGFSRN